jgi:hypothetical protein
MRWLILVGMLAFAECTAPPPPNPTYSHLTSPVVQQAEWQECLKQYIGEHAAEGWDSTAGQSSPLSSAQITEPALRKCLPSAFGPGGACRAPSSRYGYICGGIYPEIFADDLFNQAEGRHLDRVEATRSELRAKKAANDQVKLTQQEPAILDAWRNCLFSTVRRLAVVSNEPAEVVVKATFAACREPRQQLIELHNRYGDPAFNDARVDVIESRIAGKFLLEVVQIRAAQPAPSSPQMPPHPPPPEEPAI